MVSQNKPRLAKERVLEVGQEWQVWDRVVSSKDESREETSQNFTPKNVQHMANDVLKSNKIVQMFQAMAIINLKMGNLGLEVQTLKTKLGTIVEGEKQGLLQ
jgi:hypothetical protein